MAYDKNYGSKTITQPGGGPNSPTVERSRKTVVAPCRPQGSGIDHTNKGGNPPRNLNPFGGRKYTGE